MSEPRATPGVVVDQPVGFRAVLCGVDGSPASVAAVRQALELGAQDTKYWALAAWNPGPAMHAGLAAPDMIDKLREEARSGLRRAREVSPLITPVLMRGGEVAALLAGLANFEADLVATGSHGGSRAAGIIFGSVASAMAHFAPCSVLIARDPSGRSFPEPILLADDGSPESLEAASVAATLAAQHAATLIAVRVGEEPGGSVDGEAVRRIESLGVKPTLRGEQGSPHRRIVEVANEVGASLIVMGSRGRTGIAALGSVSERVAHRATCSVLIVRRPSHPAREEAALGD